MAFFSSSTDSAPTGATAPAQLTIRDWRQLLAGTRERIKRDNLGTLAAGVAYYVTLAIFPGLLAVGSILSLVLGPATLRSEAQALGAYLPDALAQLLNQQLQLITQNGSSGLGLAALIGVLTLTYSASAGMQAVIKATTVAYGEEEGRNMIKLRLLSMLLTIVVIISAAFTMPLIVLSTESLRAVGLPTPLAEVVVYGRWPLLAGIFTLLLAILYRYAPYRTEPKWQWVSWGAGLATLLWIVASALFFFYTQHFDKSARTYGSLSGVAVLMAWLYISSFVILLGAEINSQLEAKGEGEGETVAQPTKGGSVLRRLGLKRG